jgi:excisionase family DNA binding protein
LREEKNDIFRLRNATIEMTRGYVEKYLFYDVVSLTDATKYYLTKRRKNNMSNIEPALLTVEQVCQLINVKRATLYRLKATGHFAPLPVGLCRKVLYLRSEVEEWLKAKCPHRKQWYASRTDMKPCIR